MSFTIHEPQEKGMKPGLLLVFIDNVHFLKQFIEQFNQIFR